MNPLPLSDKLLLIVSDQCRASETISGYLQEAGATVTSDLLCGQFDAVICLAPPDVGQELTNDLLRSAAIVHGGLLLFLSFDPQHDRDFRIMTHSMGPRLEPAVYVNHLAIQPKPGASRDREAAEATLTILTRQNRHWGIMRV